MVYIDGMIDYVQNHREIEDSNNMVLGLGGYLTRKALLRQKSSFNMALGNHKLATKDLPKTLKIGTL